MYKRQSSTRWRSVSDQKNKVYYFESNLTPNLFWLDLKKIDFSPKAGIKKLSLTKGEIYAGDAVTVSYTHLFPRGIQRMGHDKEKTVKWTSKYGSVIATGYDLSLIHISMPAAIMQNRLPGLEKNIIILTCPKNPVLRVTKERHLPVFPSVIWKVG